MTFLQRVENAQKLWKFVIPETPLPPNETWIRWLTSYRDEQFEKVVLQIPNRFRSKKPSAEEVYRCVSSMLSNRRGMTEREALAGGS
jgi:hypothetical protein